MADLVQQFLAATNFELAWEQVATNQGCAGVDGETIAQFGLHKDAAIANLIAVLAKGKYRPLPLWQLFIPKAEDGWRELGVPTVRDRLVQQALLQVLHPLMEREFEGCSFAYRPGRSHLMAVRQVAHWRDRGYEWVLDADIVQYFEQVQHLRLLAEVEERLVSYVGEEDIRFVLSLIEAWISVGVLTQAGLVLPQKGIPQGAVISPLLANIYLDDFDAAFASCDLRLVRFSDDFVLLGRRRSRLVQAQAEVEQLLSSMGLQLHADKTRITNFEQGFRFLGHAFAGDVVVRIKKPTERKLQPVKREELRLVHAEASTQPTVMQQALVEALKTAGTPIPPPLFVVLGYAVRSAKSVSIDSDEMVWKADMSTLYLVQQGTTLRKEQGRFLIQPPKEDEAEVPIREVERILVFGTIQLTAAVISTCLELQIPVVFLSQLGEYKGHLWSAESADLVVETAQFQRQQDESFKRAIAREVVQGKLWNSKQLLLRLNRKRQLPEVAEVIAKLDGDREAVSQLGNTPTLDTIRGYEGAGAARYFAALNQLIVNPGFSLTERAFHPPTDPMNSLLSFGYTLLFNNVFSLLLAEGLNPYLGNLHGAERPKAYLAFDLMEEFRSPIVDTLVMKLVNQKILKPTDFTWPTQDGGVYITDPARRIFLKYFEERMCEQVSHPDVKEPVSYRRVIQLQIQRYAKVLLGNHSYESFRRVI